MTTLFGRGLVGLGVCLAMLGAGVRAEDKPMQGFLNRVHKDPDGQEARYVLFVPHALKADTPAPLILFLHGAGESGSDGKRQAEVGLGAAVRRMEKTFPFFVIFPQSQKRSWQAGGPDAQRALDILAGVQKEFKIDPQRIYLTGLSMGGYGTWSLAAKEPGRWAAIAPICGGVGRGGDAAKTAQAIKDVPCWCFHGGADNVVPPSQSRAVVKALWEAGGHPNYTEYPGVGHNSWDKAYATRDLYDWFLGHKLKK